MTRPRQRNPNGVFLRRPGNPAPAAPEMHPVCFAKFRPMALRPCLSTGLPLSILMYSINRVCLYSLHALFNSDPGEIIPNALSIYICFGLYFPRLHGTTPGAREPVCAKF